MSELLDDQMKFPLMLAKLLIFAYEEMGLTVTMGEGYNASGTGHMKNSCHYFRLAQDINLFKNGAWLDKGPDMESAHGRLHDYWDRLGGAQRIQKDLNHYSIEYQGRR